MYIPVSAGRGFGRGCDLTCYFAFFAAFLLVIAAIVGLILFLIHFKKSYQFDEIKSVPTDLPWTRNLREKTTHSQQGIHFGCHEYEKQYRSPRTPDKEIRQGAVKWVRRILNKRHRAREQPKIRVPKTSYVVQIPMKNFKCGKEFHEFTPTSGDPPSGYFTYQMCGVNRFQIVRYVEDDVTYFAGYCIYIQPYSGEYFYRNKHIDQCYLGPEYVPKATSLADAEPLLENGQDRNQNHTDALSKFKPHFCKRLEQIVALGSVNGDVKHFVWSKWVNDYIPIDCASCELEEFEEIPPGYGTL